MELNQTKVVDEQDNKKQDHDKMKKYNSAIENEAELKDFSKNQDIYGTVNQYMKLVNQFSLLLLFGL